MFPCQRPEITRSENSQSQYGRISRTRGSKSGASVNLPRLQDEAHGTKERRSLGLQTFFAQPHPKLKIHPKYSIGADVEGIRAQCIATRLPIDQWVGCLCLPGTTYRALLQEYEPRPLDLSLIRGTFWYPHGDILPSGRPDGYGRLVNVRESNTEHP